MLDVVNINCFWCVNMFGWMNVVHLHVWMKLLNPPLWWTRLGKHLSACQSDVWLSDSGTTTPSCGDIHVVVCIVGRALAIGHDITERHAIIWRNISDCINMIFFFQLKSKDMTLSCIAIQCKYASFNIFCWHWWRYCHCHLCCL